MAPLPKTNAMRALDARGIAYEVLVYGKPDDEFHTAVDVAAMLGLPPQEVYKTIVVLRDGGRPLLVMVAADREIDLRLLAHEIGAKRVYIAPRHEAERMTGLRVGCISALALLGKPFESFLDRPGESLDRIAVSAGQRGQQIRLATPDLLAVSGARVIAATAT